MFVCVLVCVQGGTHTPRAGAGPGPTAGCGRGSWLMPISVIRLVRRVVTYQQ